MFSIEIQVFVQLLLGCRKGGGGGRTNTKNKKQKGEEERNEVCIQEWVSM